MSEYVSPAFSIAGSISSFVSARVDVLSRVAEVLLCQPRGFLVVLRDVDALDLEDDRAGSVIAAGDHHAVVVGPALHDGAALQCCINITADGVPGLAAELAVHKVIKVVLLRRALEQKGISLLEKRAGPGLGIGQIGLLIFRKAFGVQHRDLTFVFHSCSLSPQVTYPNYFLQRLVSLFLFVHG